MKKITVNGQVYLGDVTLSDGNITVRNALTDLPNDIRRLPFIKYCQYKNLDKLITVEFAGHGTTYSVTDLTKDQELELKIVLLNMRKVKKIAIRNLENDMLDSLLGKQ